MKRRFIVLIDFSGHAPNLIRYASDWALQAAADLLLVHQPLVSAPVMTPGDSKQELAGYAEEEALEKLKILAEDFVPPGISVSFFVSAAPLRLSLAALLEDPFEQLIFTGLKGTGLFKKIFLGSVAVEVIDSLHHLVVAMPKEISGFSHEKVFVAVPEDQSLNLPELTRLLELMGITGTSIVFFHLSDDPGQSAGLEPYLQQLATTFSLKYTTSYAIFHGKQSFSEIKQVINNRIEEILVVQRGTRLLTDRMFRRFLVNELVFDGQTPLVVLPRLEELIQP